MKQKCSNLSANNSNFLKTTQHEAELLLTNPHSSGTAFCKSGSYLFSQKFGSNSTNMLIVQDLDGLWACSKMHNPENSAG